MRNIKLVVAYVGTNYHGFQKQPQGGTIQDVLEEFLSKVCGEPVEIAGSGRTDAGVHALAQTVSFKTKGTIPCENIVKASRGMLPNDIAVIGAEEMASDFHARFSAKWKAYRYCIYTGRENNPFVYDRAWQIKEKLNILAMEQAAQLLVGEHDFTNFRSTGSEEGSAVRTIYQADLTIKDMNLYFDIVGNGFLYHMVRNIVSGLVQIGLGRHELVDFQKALQLQPNALEHSPAPAQGLYLVEVGYKDYNFA